jgi:hypothetical protein
MLLHALQGHTAGLCETTPTAAEDERETKATFVSAIKERWSPEKSQFTL